jgi:hypothetical protein
LKDFSIPDAVTKIDIGAFAGTGIKSIVIPDSVEEIKANPFVGCANLMSIIVSEGNKVYDSRNQCNAIIETATNALISGCSSTVIPDSVTKISPNGYFGGAFQGCSLLTTIAIPGSVTEIGERSFRASGLTSINIPDSVTKIGDEAFKDCAHLENVVIPETLTKMGNDAFRGSALTSISIPKAVEQVSENAFRGCTALKSVTIFSSILGEQCFAGCTALETVTLGVGIKSFDDDSFEGCTAIKTVYVPAKKADYYKKRLPGLRLRDLIVELPVEKKSKK